MSKKSNFEGPVRAKRLYDALVAANANVEVKGASTPYTSRNGHMFSFLDTAGTLAIRLPAPLRGDFLAKYDSQIVEQHGRVMAEYVSVPTGLLSDTAELQAWFDESYEWIGTLTPKPTTRRKKSIPS